ncbi:MAG: o-succinylbenzoate--CoA ligase [Deltaproteobacteria bacterium]
MTNNLGLFLTKRAHLSPDLEGFVGTGSGLRLSFSELNRRSNRTANMLTGLGVKKGDRVALLLMNDIEFVESFFAIAKLGGVVVPLNWRLVGDELAFILDDSGASTLIFGHEFAELSADLQARTRECRGIKNWLVAGDVAPAAGVSSYKALCEAASDEEPRTGAADDDELYIMYTSGTTGLPKGAVHTHDSAMWACITINATADTHYGDRYLVALPLFHVGALTPMVANVYGGATSIVMYQFDPVRVWEIVEEERLSSMLAVPAMLNFMLQAGGHDKVDHSRLRWVMSGAAPVPVTLIEAYAELGIEIHQVYGLTETCGPACLISPEDAIRKAGSTGKPFFHTEVRVIDDSGAELPAGEMGEVIISGRHLMKGYWNRPDATAEALRDGWLHSGDLASMDGDGFVYIQDRKKDMIISGGENVYPAEIENVILSHPEVRDVAVVGLPSEKWGESPLAVVVAGAEGLAAESVIEHCKGRLARFKLPRTVEFVDEIPRNPTGKILKRVLRERFPGPAPE